jgi:hypothetical protein
LQDNVAFEDDRMLFDKNDLVIASILALLAVVIALAALIALLVCMLG